MDVRVEQNKTLMADTMPPSGPIVLLVLWLGFLLGRFLHGLFRNCFLGSTTFFTACHSQSLLKNRTYIAALSPQFLHRNLWSYRQAEVNYFIFGRKTA